MTSQFKRTGKIDADPEDLESARAYNRRLQELGRGLVSTLYMLVRNVKLYDPDNAIFVKPLENFKETVNTIISMEGKLSLQCAGDSFYLNDMLIRIETKSAETMRQLRAELEQHDVGGFELAEPITTAEIRNFIYVFSNEYQQEVDEHGVTSRKLEALKLRHFEKLQEILKAERPADEVEGETGKLDRKRYGLVVYARLVMFMRKYIAGLRGEGPKLPISKTMHFIQDLVDVVHGFRTHFVGLGTLERGSEYLCFHAVNVAVLSTIFGSELGLSKEWLRELGIAALFHDIGKAEFDEELLIKQERLRPDEARKMERAPIYGARRLMQENKLNRRVIQCIITARDHVIDWGEARKDHKGETAYVRQKNDVSLFARIVALVDCYDHLTTVKKIAPDIALAMMNSNLKHRFDQDLLRIFTNLMRDTVTKVFAGTGEKLTLF